MIQIKNEQFIRKICSKCPYYGRNIVMGYGNVKYRLMIIGEAPGAIEELKGEPFVGRSGILINKMFDIICINRSYFYVTNVVKCRPDNNKLDNVEIIDLCFTHLKYEILKINPHIIVTFGSTAFNTLIKYSDYSKDTKFCRDNIGRRIKIVMNGVPLLLFPMYHPSYILRGGLADEVYIKHFVKLKETILDIFTFELESIKEVINNVIK